MSSGVAGSKVTVEGFNFVPREVEIRWNGLDGPKLATTTGPGFSEPFTIPPAPPGLYTVLVTSRRPDGGVADIVRAPFQVTSSAPGGAELSGTALQDGISDNSSALPPALAALFAVTTVVAYATGRRRRGRSEEDLATVGNSS